MILLDTGRGSSPLPLYVAYPYSGAVASRFTQAFPIATLSVRKHSFWRENGFTLLPCGAPHSDIELQPGLDSGGSSQSCNLDGMWIDDSALLRQNFRALKAHWLLTGQPQERIPVSRETFGPCCVHDDPAIGRTSHA